MNYQVLFPQGRKKAFTLSYDDAQIFDKRLVEMFNKYQVKGTFHLNVGALDKEDEECTFIKKDEVRELYKGHEISSHGYHHPYFNQLTQTQMINEILEDRKELEGLAGYPVRGMSYPFGEFDENLIQTASSLGMEYARTVEDTMSFTIPSDFMRWHPTCHHNKAMDVIEEFLNPPAYRELMLFYVWGHSFEFAREDNWDYMEDFLEKVSGKEDVWYATNIEIKDYIMACRNLKVTIDETVFYNPSGIPVWVQKKDRLLMIMPGETIAC